MNTTPAIPDHLLFRPIGRGAYGEVWLAQNVMGAARAVKVVWRRQFESDRPYEREFAGIQKYEPVSRSSGGLVHVLHVGRNDAEGYFYYVMELADAAEPRAESPNELRVESRAPSAEDIPQPSTPTSLNYTPRTLRFDLKRLGRLPTADCLRLALDVLTGLAQLHRHGLIHRDVKPGNIIYVNGRAKLADIGLVTTDGEGRTFVGTEGYIPPEGPGTPAADLYALGIVLYEASTGLPPDRFPDVPAEWFTDPAGDDALEFHEIVLKACEGDRARRYPSIEAMQADLALLQSGQSVRRVRALEWRATWAWRAGWAAVAAVLIAVGAALVAGWRARVAERTSAREAGLRTRAEAAEQDAQQKLYRAYLAQARATVLSGDFGRRFRTLEAVRQAAAIRATPELRREAFAALALPDLRIEGEINLGGRVTAAAVDAAFARYAVSRPRGPVEVHSVADGRLLQILPPSTNRNAQVLRFSPDGRYLAFKRDHGSGSDSDLEVWDLAGTQRVVLARHAVAHNALTFHPRAPRLLAGQPDGRLVTWDLEHGIEAVSLRLPRHLCVCYSPDGDRFALAREDSSSGAVEVRDAATGTVLASHRFPDLVRQVAWHPDGQRLAVPCGDASVSLMDAQDGAVRVLGWHKAQAVEADFSADGDFLFSSGWDNEINVWNLRSFQRELTAAVSGAMLQPGASGRHAALVAESSRLQILQFSRTAECRELVGEFGFGGRAARFSDDGRWLAVPTINGVGVWDLGRPGPAAVFDRAGIGGVVFVPPGNELIGWSDRRLFRWRLVPAAQSNSPPRLEPRPACAIKPPLFSAHLLARRSALLLSDAGGVRVLPLTNAITGETVLMEGALGRAALSEDERWLATAWPRQPVVRLFRLPGLVEECALTNPAPVRALGFTPSGRGLLVLTQGRLSLWGVGTWRLERSQPAAVGGFGNFDCGQDGHLVLVTESARSGALLELPTLEPRLPLPVWTHPLALSPDGRTFAVLVESRRVQLWDLAAVRARFRELGIDWKD